MSGVIIKWRGKEIELIQDPYVGDGEYYMALGVDDEENTYRISWDFRDCWRKFNQGDEVDWDKFYVKKL